MLPGAFKGSRARLSGELGTEVNDGAGGSEVGRGGRHS
jgi:hypothetical protein